MATAIRPATGHPPAVALITAGILGFLGVSAVGGGLALAGGITAPPDRWLARIPLIDSWLVPGLVLGLGFGLGSLVIAVGVLRRPRWPWLGPVERLSRHHWSWAATVLIGLGQLAWIGLELVYLPELSALQLVYGTIGLALAVLPLLGPNRRYLALATITTGPGVRPPA